MTISQQLTFVFASRAQPRLNGRQRRGHSTDFINAYVTGKKKTRTVDLMGVGCKSRLHDMSCVFTNPDKGGRGEKGSTLILTVFSLTGGMERDMLMV